MSPLAHVASRSAKTLVLSVALALLLLPLPSHAGQWVITFTGGTTALPLQAPSNPGNYTFTDAPQAATPNFSELHFSSTTNGGGVCELSHPASAGTVTLSVTAKLTWTPSFTGDTSQPPLTQDVLETAGATAAAYVVNPVGLSTGGDDGFRDASIPYSTTTGAVSTGKHLWHLTIGAGQTTVTLPPRSLKAWLTYSSSQGGGGGALVVSYAVSPDNREVTLYRDGARSPGIVYSPDHQPHGEYMDASGVAHGETTYSCLLGPSDGSYSPVLQGNWQIFHPTFSGSWKQKTVYNFLGQAVGTAPDVSWAWSPNESDDTWNTGKCETPISKITYFTNGGSTGKSGGPTTYPVGYGATDNGDGATAGAAYALVVHDQWDNLRPDPSHPFDVIDNDVLVVVGGHQITQENDASSTPASVGPISIAFTVSATLTAQLNGSFKLSDFFTLGGNFQASASVSGTIGEQITGPAIPPKSYIQLYFHTHYHKNHWLVDHYTASGYDSTYTELIDTTPDIAELHWGHSNSLPF